MRKWTLLLLFVTTVTFADIGSVTSVTGPSIIKRGASTITVVAGTPVESNDRVETKSGEVKITFKDNTTVKVAPSSALVIDDFVYDPKTQGGKLGLRAAEGTVRYVSGNIAHNNPNAVNIKTPTASIAVRGTDFVMSVDETGKSLVMLMPTCEENVQIVNLKGLVCGSGKIDVDSGGHIVHLSKPYEATIVGINGDIPTAPIVVNLSNTPIGNNLIITPPQTLAGISVQTAAKAAAQKTGDAAKDSGAKDSGPKDATASAPPADSAAQVTQQQQQQQQQRESDQQAADAQAAKAVQQAVSELDALMSAGVKVNSSPAQDSNVFEVFKDNNPNLNQIGWGYATLSPNGHNYANVSLPSDTQVLVVVTQDRQTDAYNFGPAKPQGSITISQTYNGAGR